MSRYKHLFFDLDRTLWDFEKNSRISLLEMYQNMGIDNYVPSVDLFLSLFDKYNAMMWREFERGNISKDIMRVKRFDLILRDVKIKNIDFAKELNNAYLKICPSKPHLFDKAQETLTMLSEKYVLHIVSNGFIDIQENKMHASGIHHFFKEIITCDVSGYVKPDKRMFDYALNRCKIDRKQVLMIGDDYENDIVGAINSGIDSCFVDYAKGKCDNATYYIHHLSELTVIL